MRIWTKACLQLSIDEDIYILVDIHLQQLGGPGFGMGMGAGALAAGAVIFGDDFMSGFDFPGGYQNASLTISTDPSVKAISISCSYVSMYQNDVKHFLKLFNEKKDSPV
ncbi:unnamed protein product [Ilex paraguariensis]|uniref:Uncharacterized protein n=1 Tax=Ilex paraguariensis TaxID=185542 RepID=A0ABC8UQN2_9AQUA